MKKSDSLTNPARTQSAKTQSTTWNNLASLGAVWCALLLTAGCASTQISDRNEMVTGKLPRPHHIWVYDFAATAADVPAHSALADGSFSHPRSQTPQEIAEGRKVGHLLAAELVMDIRALGITAELATPGFRPEVNDIVLRGYILSIHEGSVAKRVGIGFGEGASELKTALEGFQATGKGWRKLGSGDLDAGGSKTPGAALGVATLIATANPAGLIISSGVKVYGEESGSSKVEGRVKQTAKEIATILKQRFQQQGWIN